MPANYDQLKIFDILLFPGIGNLYYHAGMYAGKHHLTGLPMIYESLSRGPILHEFESSRVPAHIIRRNHPFTQNEVVAMGQAMYELAEMKYDYAGFAKALLTGGLWLDHGGTNRIRCDELICLCYRHAGIPLNPNPLRPKGFLYAPGFSPILN